MSRVYFTASMPHEKFGVGLPTLSFETNDHTGGGYDIGGLHPTSIATLFGKGPEVKKGERFDLKFNLNAKRYVKLDFPSRPSAPICKHTRQLIYITKDFSFFSCDDNKTSSSLGVVFRWRRR